MSASPTNHKRRTVIQQIQTFEHNFGQIYIGGIPSLLNHECWHLSFVTTLTAIDTLAGLRYVDSKKSKVRFQRFVKLYFPKKYSSMLEDIYTFRCAMIHAFCPRPFNITIKNPSAHHRKDEYGNTILNAENFYSELVDASALYFEGLRQSTHLQRLFRKKIREEEGDMIMDQIILQRMT